MFSSFLTLYYNLPWSWNARYQQGSHVVSEKQLFCTGPYQTPQHHVNVFSFALLLTSMSSANIPYQSI